ncbi:hypothetical protein KA005_48710 [bacterium]|nr:hypothetical protein [bacterium]
MAVIVCKSVRISNSDVEMKTYLPSGVLSKEDRIRADLLEEELSKKMPIIAEKLLEMAQSDDNLVFQRHTLGRYLREIIDDSQLVSRTDVENKLIFMAIWDHLPDSLRPIGPAGGKPPSEDHLRRKDHLMLCYEISAFDWPEVEWIKRWDDWYRLAFRPGLVRDKRILKALGEAINELGTYPSARAFREIAKLLGRAFPTRRLRDSSLFTDEKISQIVRKTLQQANRSPGLKEKRKTTMRK